MMFEVEFIGTAGSGAVTVTWNPLDTNQDPFGLVQFANGNLDAFETTMVRQGVRATISRTTGKRYFEIDIIALTNGGADVYIGLCPIGTALNHNAADASNAIVWRGNGVIKDKVNGPALSPYVAGDTCQCAVDLDNAKAWLARLTNTWIGGGDPAAGTLETVLYTNSVGLALFPNYQSDNITVNEQRVRILGHASNQHNAAPAGFTPWGD